MPLDPHHTYIRWRDRAGRSLELELRKWEAVVDSLERPGLYDGWDDYTGALWCRDALKRAVRSAPFRQRKAVTTRLSQLDRRFSMATIPSRVCVIDSRNCDPVTEWWYFRVPKSRPDWPEDRYE